MADPRQAPQISVPRIDAHHHFWHYTPEEYPWIDASMSALRRDFLPADLEIQARAAGIDGVVTVQARQTIEETQWLLQMANAHPLIHGVVGWAPIAGANFAAHLDTLCAQPLLKGLRHGLQGEPDAFMADPAFNQGLALLKQTDLVYDVLIVEHQLAAATRMIDRHPGQVFVLDHLAKPKIGAGVLEPWREHVRDLARREHVYCKLSGLVTEADWHRWTSTDLKPYVDTVLEAFGAGRLIAGSDWPVCLVAASYTQWFGTLRTLLQKLSDDEQEQIFGGNATTVYQLKSRILPG